MKKFLAALLIQIIFKEGLAQSPVAPSDISATPTPTAEGGQVTGPVETESKPTTPKAGIGYKSEILEGFYEEFFYVPEDKRDPFSPWQPKINFSPVAITNPLQKFSLEQLVVVGLISNVAEPKALILDPTGTSHIAKENTRIGNSNGYIAKIREGEVVVIEEHYDIEGNKAYKTKILLFRK